MSCEQCIKKSLEQLVLDQTELMFQDVRKNAMQTYFKYKAYYDRKNKCFQTQKTRLRLYATYVPPIAYNQGSKAVFTDIRWIGPYIVEKVLTN